MSDENVEIVRGAVEHFVKTGEPEMESLDPDAIQVEDHDIFDGRDYKGTAGVLQWLQDWGDAWSEYSLDPAEYIDAGVRVIVVARVRATGRGSGAKLERQDALLYELRDGKIVRIDYFNNKPAAMEAAGIG